MINFCFLCTEKMEQFKKCHDMVVKQMDMPLIRQNLSKLRYDWRTSCPESVFRISTVLPNGMTYAEFTLHFLLRNKKKTSDQPFIKTIRKKRSKSRSLSPPLPVTRQRKVRRVNVDPLVSDVPVTLAKDFADIVGKVEDHEPIQKFIVKKRKKRKSN